MNIFLRLGHWWELQRGIKKLEFEERVRPVERYVETAIPSMKAMMSRVSALEGDGSAVRQLQALRDRVERLERSAVKGDGR